jgi:hypothetical protein
MFGSINSGDPNDQALSFEIAKIKEIIGLKGSFIPQDKREKLEDELKKRE